MEEILASIRRIIADDQPRASESQGAAAKSADADAVEAKRVEANGDTPVPLTSHSDPAGPMAAAAKDDAFRLRGAQSDAFGMGGGAAVHVLRPEAAAGEASEPAEDAVVEPTKDAAWALASSPYPAGQGTGPSPMDGQRGRPDSPKSDFSMPDIPKSDPPKSDPPKPDLAMQGAIGTPQFATPDGPPRSDDRQGQVAALAPPRQGPEPTPRARTESLMPGLTRFSATPVPPSAAADRAVEPASQAAAADRSSRPSLHAEAAPQRHTLQPAPPPRSAPAAGLISSATDQSVSSAFNMLAASRLADNSDELIELAREMIRPMLRAWLDDNLPPMVERMVRAEIERVARGGR